MFLGCQDTVLLSQFGKPAPVLTALLSARMAREDSCGWK